MRTRHLVPAQRLYLARLLPPTNTGDVVVEQVQMRVQLLPIRVEISPQEVQNQGHNPPVIVRGHQVQQEGGHGRVIIFSCLEQEFLHLKLKVLGSCGHQVRAVPFLLYRRQKPHAADVS
jgi:hypothetical protein